MTTTPVRVAVVGAGLGGRAHAAAYRNVGTMANGATEVDLVVVADTNVDLASVVARRYGFRSAVSDWTEVATSPDVDAVSIVVGNELHRPIAEALLQNRKHVLCEKPLAASLEDARAMALAAVGVSVVAATGFTLRRSPAIAAIARLVAGGEIGAVLEFRGRYWCDYALSPETPMSWRYRGGSGSGALADLGSHIIDLAEQIVAPIEIVAGAQLATRVSERAVPLNATVGHELAPTGDVAEVVTNEDSAVFTTQFRGGAVGSFSVSRVAFGFPNGLKFDVLGERGRLSFDLERPGEFIIEDGARHMTSGPRRVLVGPSHPYVAAGLPMPFSGAGYGISDYFVFQANAFLRQVAGETVDDPCATFDDGRHGVEVIHSVVASAASIGYAVKIS